MPIDRFEPNSLTPEQQSVDAIKKSLNKEFSENLSGYEKDMERVERLRSAFDQVDHAFSAERITCPKDAQEIPLSTIDDIARGKPFEEQCAIITYFLANKIALTEPLTEERFQSFKESKERTEMVKAVKTYFDEQSVEDPNWEEEWNKFVSETQAFWDQRTAEAYAALQAAGEEIKENAEQLVNDASATAAVVWNEAVDLAQETAEVVVDGAVATCYVTQMAAVGGVRFAENCYDYVAASALTLSGNEDVAMEVIQNDVSDDLITRIDEFYDPNESLRAIGHSAVTVGEAATGIGLTIAAFSCTAGGAAALGAATTTGEALFATVQFATGIEAARLVGLNAAGNSLDDAVQKTGEISVREVTAATVKGVTITAATVAAGLVNNYIPPTIAETVAKWATTDKKITLEVGGRLVGVLSNAAMGAADVGLYEVADMTSNLTDVALGIETDYDVVQDLQNSLVSIAGAAVLSGVGYGVFRSIRGSKLFQNFFKKPYTPDYFDYVYQSELENYAIDLVITPKADWNDEQLAQAQAKVDILNESDLVKTPVVRNGSASTKYKVENGLTELPPNMDVDHSQELQLGGLDEISNMKLIDSSVNRSFGSQIQNQIKDLPYGTPIKNVMFA